MRLIAAFSLFQRSERLASLGEFFDAQPVDAATQFVDLNGSRIDLHPQTAGRFVDQVDRLVGKLTTRNVASGEGCRRDKCRV